ncbi:MAG: hypothetical protein ACLTZY_06440 [Alistipes indistinctus]
MKDQRKERRPRLGNTPREENETPRRSFNPNFTRDNRRKDDGSARYNDRFRRDDDHPGRDDDRRSGKPFRKTTSLTAVMGMKSGPTATTAAKTTAAEPFLSQRFPRRRAFFP